MDRLTQSPTDPDFVQNPYPFYARARVRGPLHHWATYDMVAAFDHATVYALLRDRRFGRAVPPEMARPVPAHLAAWGAVEAVSLLEMEPPGHTRLRGLILRAFTSRRIAAQQTGIEALCHQLVDAFPDGPFDLLSAYCAPVPVTVIARLLGVPEAMGPQLLDWSHAMVAMYQANRTPATEQAAERAAEAFTAFLEEHVRVRRTDPRDDLITTLIAAETDRDALSTAELIGTCILLLNAGHEATVHSLGNGVKALLEMDDPLPHVSAERVADTVEEILRYDPPLHMFTRYAYEPVTIAGHSFARGDQVALLLGAANHDPALWPDPDRFDPTRTPGPQTGFGGGLHFCVGAPLARQEMQIALRVLFARCPKLHLAEPPRYADSYHFHGLERLMVQVQ